MKRFLLRGLLAGMIAFACAPAALARLDSVPQVKVGKVTLAPTGRMLLDGAAYTPSGDGLNAGATLSDVRLGMKAGFGSWSARVDIGYSAGKFGLRDVWLRYDFDKANSLTAGYIVHQFGLNAATSGSMKPAMEAAAIDNLFAAGARNLGFQYNYNLGQFFASASAIVSGRCVTTPANEQGKVSYGGMTRLVWRPLRREGLIAQVGFSAWLQSAEHSLVDKIDPDTKKPVVNSAGKLEKVPSAGYFKMTSNFPTRVCSTEMLCADVTDARHLLKLSPEWLLAYGRVAAEGQYYYGRASRHGGLSAYRVSGVYNLLRGILIGRDYQYNSSMSCLATPGAKTLELVLGYNYADACDSKAGIMGGRSNDVSANLNYYFNRYIIAKLGWRYVNVRNSCVQPDRHENMFQARIQFIF